MGKVEEVVVVEADQDTRVVFAWDGRVLEVFSWLERGALRLHREILDLEIGGPDRKGRYEVKVGYAVRTDAGERRFQRGSWSWKLDESQMQMAQPLLDSVQGATEQ
ncbi:MAG: hypothetical protein ACRDL6_02995 [Solirubrobacterales bacterium]